MPPSGGLPYHENQPLWVNATTGGHFLQGNAPQWWLTPPRELTPAGTRHRWGRASTENVPRVACPSLQELIRARKCYHWGASSVGKCPPVVAYPITGTGRETKGWWCCGPHDARRDFIPPLAPLPTTYHHHHHNEKVPHPSTTPPVPTTTSTAPRRSQPALHHHHHHHHYPGGEPNNISNST